MGTLFPTLSYSSQVTRKLPLEKAAVFVGTEKMTMDVGPEVRFQLGREDALRFYMFLVVLVGGVNKRGLGWLRRRFQQVSWSTLELVQLHSPVQGKRYKSINMDAPAQSHQPRTDILDREVPLILWHQIFHLFC